MSSERVLTAAIAIFGIFFLFWIIPNQVETVSYGRIVPSTVPTFAGAILVLTAVIQLFTSKQTIEVNWLYCLRAALFVVLMIVSVWLMEQFGFEYVAPALALLVMVLIGERRWYWLACGGFVIPLGTWLIVERLLDRPLA